MTKIRKMRGSDGRLVSSRRHSKSLQEAALTLGKDVDDVTPIDLLAYDKEDLPAGKKSPLGGEVQNAPLRTRPESETRRLAEIGRAAVDAAAARAQHT